LPQVDPCCFPLLHPRGTPGHRWYLKKGRGPRTHTREVQDEEQMQNNLDDALDESFIHIGEEQEDHQMENEMGTAIEERLSDVLADGEGENFEDESGFDEGQLNDEEDAEVEPTTHPAVEIFEEEIGLDQEVALDEEFEDVAFEVSVIK
jgi:hypothetical protein